MPVDKIDDVIKYYIPSDKEIRKEIEKLNIQFTKFINKYNKKIEGLYKINNVIISIKILEDVVIHVDKRLEHYKIFHKIEESNEYRTISFYCYWIIKLHPFLIEYEKVSTIKDINYVEFESINEAFALYLYQLTVKEIHRRRNENIILDTNYLNELRYTLRYRDLNKSNLLLLFEPKFKI